jgi:hypothetical protein
MLGILLHPGTSHTFEPGGFLTAALGVAGDHSVNVAAIHLAVAAWLDSPYLRRRI